MRRAHPRAELISLLSCLLLAACEEHIVLGPPSPYTPWQGSEPGVDASVVPDARIDLDLEVHRSFRDRGATVDGGGACQAVKQGDQLCLICTARGKEISRQCVPADQTCIVTSAPQEVCVECRAPSGQVTSKQCFPLQQSCVAQAINGKLCLVCKDGAGTVVKTHCEGGAGGG